jgi:hypothetical protein
VSQFRLGNEAASGQQLAAGVQQLAPSGQQLATSGQQLVPLGSSRREPLPAAPQRDFVYGDESRLSNFHLLEQSQRSIKSPPARRGGGRTRGGGGVNNLSKTMSNLTIDNSVNAVRAWTPAVEQQQKKQQQQQKLVGKAVGSSTAATPCSDNDDSFSKFLRENSHPTT